MDFDGLCTVLSRMDVDTENLRPNQNGQVTISCPLAPWFHEGGTDFRPGLSIAVDRSPSVFKCFGCGECGTIADLVESYATLKDDADLVALAWRLRESDKPTLGMSLDKATRGFDSWVRTPESHRPQKLNPELMSITRFPALTGASLKYCYERGITLDSLREFDIRYDPRQRRVIFPVRDCDHTYGAVGRAYAGDTPKYWNYFGFAAGKSLGGLDRVTDRPKVLVVEGFFDILKSWPYAQDKGYDMVCTWHADLSEYQAEQLASLDKTIIFAYDNDAAGDSGWERACKRLHKTSILSRITPPKGTDLGDMSRPQFESFLNSRRIRL